MSIPKQWHLDPKWRGRLIAEQQLMRDRFPSFELRRGRENDLYWVGYLVPVPGVVFRVAIRYPRTYPYNAPTLQVLEPQLHPGAPHRYADSEGTICIHKQAWDPATGTAASIVPLAAAWLVAYCDWLVTGETF